MSEPQKQDKNELLKNIGEFLFFIISPPLYLSKKAYDFYKSKKPAPPPVKPPE